MLKKALQFLFGKPPAIFDQDGNVQHHFPKEKWQTWENRFHDQDYDWHQHKGKESGGKPADSKPAR